MARKVATAGTLPARDASTTARKSSHTTATGRSPRGNIKVMSNKTVPAAIKQSQSSPYAIMAGRLANRVAELAEGLTFIERPKTQPRSIAEPRKPRKIELRFEQPHIEQAIFSAPFLDSTLAKMLQLQQRMLQTTAQLSASPGVTETAVKEHAAQSAELSRIIALICAEKARQGG